MDFIFVTLDDEPFKKIKNILLEKNNELRFIKRSYFLDEADDFLEENSFEEIFNIELY